MEIPPPFQKFFIDCRLPHPALQPFIEQYIYRRINVPQGCCIEKLMPLHPAGSIDFFLSNKVEIRNFQTDASVPFLSCSIQGPRTRIKNSIRLQGEFISFTILFKATGLFRLSGMQMDQFVDKSMDIDIFDEIPFTEITERLQFAPDISSCIDTIEPYLLLLSEKSRPVPPVIEKAADILGRYQQACSIKQLARESYLSLRQLERSFIRYIGICPKTYFRIHRFLQLLQAKNKAPDKKWGSLAHEFGYYDQMHLVKEFKYFLSTTPSSFVLSDMVF